MVCIVIQLICHKRKTSYHDIAANNEFQTGASFNIDFLEELDRDLETANRNLVRKEGPAFFEQVELPKRDYFDGL